MTDNFKIIYKILTAFENSLDISDFDLNEISSFKQIKADK